MPLRNIQILVVVVVVCLACYTRAQRLKYGGKIGHNIQLIEENYVDEVDPNDLYLAAMKGIVSELDQFSDFIPPQRYQEFQSVIEQEFGGVGILIEGPPNVEQLTVVTPIPGSPGYEAGLRPGDVITAIDGRETEGLETNDATKLMRGPVGEKVVLTLDRIGESAPINVDIVRADIKVDSIYGDRIRDDSKPEFMLEEDSRIAYIRITLFGEKTVDEFKAALDKVKGDAEGIVIDLRYNPGGILEAAVAMCDMLIDGGVIVSTKGRTETAKNEARANEGVYIDQSIPIVVLVNGDSASASEIMAGCLQDAGRALVAGSRSYGKGTVQQVFSLDSDQTALKFTTARFYRPSGKNIHRTEEMTADDQWGVTPESQLLYELSDMDQLRLNLRWRRRNDPRDVGDPNAPPMPPFAGDRQLELAVEKLQELLDSPSVVPAAAAEGDDVG
ncbi:MAG: S41 family peptidase [Aureliella sp.]